MNSVKIVVYCIKTEQPNSFIVISYFVFIISTLLLSYVDIFNCNKISRNVKHLNAALNRSTLSNNLHTLHMD